VEKLIAMEEREREVEKKRSESGEGKGSCQACGKERETEKLSRCKGCESVWYCDKDCQTLGWKEKRHKSECKVYRATKAAFPEDGGVA